MPWKGAGGIPHYSARVNKAAVAVGTGAWTVLNADTVTWDLGDMWVVGNPSRLTAPIDGEYWATGGAVFASNATGDRGITLTPNGDGTFHGYQRVGAFGTGDCALIASAPFQLTAGQYVEVRVRHSRGVNLNITLAMFHMRLVAVM